ncbi:MAG: FAD-binding protein [Acidimicrobiales bacterium]|nr:FAD-binding protein [Acidimicrobiales bacterium]
MSALTSTDEALHAFAVDVGDTDPIAVEGGGTRWQTGGVLHASARLVSAPVGIADYRPEEMVITVRAGTPVAELHAVLSGAGQRSALPDRGGTVGGAVAVGENRLDLLGRGSVRDAVLQVRYVSAEGDVVTGGGPVVKNVSGFNVPKLMAGSLGTLGLIAEVVLRTNPTPPASRWLRAADVDPVAARNAVLRPSSVLWNGSSTWVLLEGHEQDLEHEVIALSSIGEFAEVEGPPDLPPYRWSLPPADAAALHRETVGDFVATIGVGIVHADTAPPKRKLDPSIAVVAERMKTLFDPKGRLNPGRSPQT